MTAVITAVPTGTWTVDPAHSAVNFQAKHMGIASVRGTFNDFQGTLVIGDDGSARAEGTVEVGSVDTNEPQRDAHLRSPDFFDAERHPRLAFVSTAITLEGDGEFTIAGELTMHGITRPVTLTAEVQGADTDPWGNDRVALEVTGQINRGDWDMKFNQVLGSGNVLVSDRVKLALDISAIRQS
jgi:polyisoprenoid-binding protein YceI